MMFRLKEIKNMCRRIKKKKIKKPNLKYYFIVSKLTHEYLLPFTINNCCVFSKLKYVSMPREYAEKVIHKLQKNKVLLSNILCLVEDKEYNDNR